MSNMVKTTILLAALTGLFILIGGYLGGKNGMYFAFFLAIIMNFLSYWFSDRIVLAMYSAKEVSEADTPHLHRIVRNLSTRAGIPMPRIYIVPQDTPNAFATGRDPEHAAVAVTEGITRILSEKELEGVIAHELAHVKNRDTLISTIAATLAGAVVMLANMARWAAFFGGGRDEDEHNEGGFLGVILLAILAPIAATLIQLAISRAREYMADETGARLAANPSGLAKALEKLHIASQSVPLEANPATSHLFIVNPLSGSSILNLFSTHPPIEERIRRLESMRI